jgi:hypothetical protein
MGGMLPLPPRTGPLDYTGPDYRDERDDPAPLRCVCFDFESLEYGPDYPCAACRRDLEAEGITG